MVVVHKKKKENYKKAAAPKAKQDGSRAKVSGRKKRSASLSSDSDSEAFSSGNHSSSEDESDFASSSESDDFEEEEAVTPVSRKKKASVKPSPVPSPGRSAKKRKLDSSACTATSIPAKGTKKTNTSKADGNSAVKSGNMSGTASSSSTSTSSLSGCSAGGVGGWKGAPVASEAAARRLVQQYMLAQNRPYSVIQIYDNLHHRAGKAVVQRALDDLSSGSDKCLDFKDYGKARIYFPDQTILQSDFSPADLSRLDAEGGKLEATLQEYQQQETALRAQSKQLESQPPDDMLVEAIADEKARAEQLRTRLAAVSGAGVQTVTAKDRAKAAAAHKKYRAGWRERKTKVRDLIDLMADGMEKSVKFVTELVGIETDEECGVELPPAMV